MQDFKDRLAFVWKDSKKWASLNKLSCYRIYDKDVPAFPLVIDVYEDRLYVSEYVKAGAPTEDESEAWRLELVGVLSEVLGFPAAKIHFKARQKQQGNRQYEKYDEKEEFFVGREGGLKFLLNLGDYLDTGLFLDHRWTRSFVRDAAPGKRVLNLFAYTGSFTVYAAAGNAFETVTVDLNQNYLTWAEKNLALNGLAGSQHRFLRRDVMEFLRSETRKTYDLIILDPPTFSNSKKMDGVMDVQKDHAWMIERCMGILNPDGILFFSNNYRKFQLDKHRLPACKFKDITSLTLPRDFRKGAHQCWVFTHPKAPDLLFKSPEVKG